jgi:peptidyl-prolyl cis-trans isomerase B (cyclophilin B)
MLNLKKTAAKAAVLAAGCVTVFCLAGCSQEYHADRAVQETPSAPLTSDGEEGMDPCTAVIEVENYGSITVELDAAAAPETVKNFVSLAEDGFYDGLTFHRIIEGFMIQGGDPDGDGTGGSGTSIKGEFQSNGVENPLSHTRGAISMARSSDYDSASSQFFIVHEDSTYLDGDYAAFGYVTDGMDVVDAICADAEPVDHNGSIAKEEQPVISSIVIEKS